MREHDRVAKEPTKKSWKEKSKKSKTTTTTTTEIFKESYWPKVIISRDRRYCDTTESSAKTSSSFFPENDSSKTSKTKGTCEIVELLCCDDNGRGMEEEKTICPITSSTEIQEDATVVCASCRDCVECQKQKRSVDVQGEVAERGTAKSTSDVERSNDYSKREESRGYEKVAGTTTIPKKSTEQEDGPIFVDLTTDEAKVTWKQTILKRFSDVKDTEGTPQGSVADNGSYSSTCLAGEPQIMIADSSSRPHRGASAGSLTTALRDRGPCVIPIQPNRSLPVHPAPPAPTRSTRKDRSPVLKLSKAMNHDVVEVEPTKSLTLNNGLRVDDEKNVETEERKRKDEANGNEDALSKESIDSSNYVVPRCLGGAKRKITDEKTEQERRTFEECRETSKRRKKSHEADSSQSREDQNENVAKEFPINCCDETIDKGAGMSQKGLFDLWNERKCPASVVVVSTTEENTGKEKEVGDNKIVPPLRLKKIVRSEADGYRSSELTSETEKESNYRIVTGATPRPESRSIPSIPASSWTTDKETNFEGSFENTVQDMAARRSLPKSDGYKLKCRRNRLRQKLRELRGKAVELAEQMSSTTSNEDTTPQQNTRLRQAMNRYEKQIENLSKLLNKLSAAIPISNDVVDVEEDNETHAKTTCVTEKFEIVDTIEEKNGETMERVSPSSSPEPPKLSPKSPLDYNEEKSSVEVRNSPPVLPRVCLAIPSSSGSNAEAIRTDERTWMTSEETSKVIMDTENFDKKRNEQMGRSYESLNELVKTPCDSTPLTVHGPQKGLLNVETTKSDTEKPSMLNRPNMVIQFAENSGNRVVREKKEIPQEKGNKTQIPSGRGSMDGTKSMDCLKLSDPGGGGNNGAIINNTTDTLEMSSVKRDKVFSPITPTSGGRQVPPSAVTSILQLQSSYCGSTVTQDNVLFAGVIEDTRNVQKVTSSSQSVVLDCCSAPLGFAQVGTTSTTNHQPITLPKNCKGDRAQNDPLQRNDGNRIMTEQFPTLGNWVARMSKKQVSKSRSKLHSSASIPGMSKEDAPCIPGTEVHKATTANTSARGNIMNIAPQWNNERWQRQQRQQQLLQQVAVSTNPPQPLPTGPSLRPTLCPPISMAQFYPNSFTIDPYGGAALGYHTAMCPYGTYPYHSRLHPGSPLAGYHLPIQETLRPLQNVDKHLGPLQDPIRHFSADILKYSGSLTTGGFQHPSNLDFDRLRGNTGTGNVGTAACLSPLILPPPPPPPPPQPQQTVPPPPPSSLSATAPQSLQRTTLNEYPTNNGQYTRNRMIPDVVAAAAAAAVVAAASFGRERTSLGPYNRTDTDSAATTTIGNVLDTEAPHSLNSGKTNGGGRDLTNQTQNDVTGYGDEARLNGGGYQQLQNLLLDRLPFVRTADNFAQTAAYSAEAQPRTGPYKMTTLVASQRQLSKDGGRNETRNCDTPHLGKVIHSPNTSSSLACSNCGVIGSMFKCLGCETAFYCDERCQTLHWNVHVEKCPKKMPKLKKVA